MEPSAAKKNVSHVSASALRAMLVVVVLSPPNNPFVFRVTACRRFSLEVCVAKASSSSLDNEECVAKDLLLSLRLTGPSEVGGAAGLTTMPLKPTLNFRLFNAVRFPTPPIGRFKPMCFFRRPSETFCTVSATLSTERRRSTNRHAPSSSSAPSTRSTACVAAILLCKGKGTPASFQSTALMSPESKKFKNSLVVTSSNRTKTLDP
mmetsp:Transcript_9397/g.21740  ORF Transcript_9397/g.21740 Transcript_9397/m.21740 type:complete len:206 (+) Transcript_9397:2547-3164(+)